MRVGCIAIVGRPNVGKSTLMNGLLGQKIAITSNHVQTTRFRIRGVLTLPRQGQIVFIDTPGFSKALDKLGEYLTTEASQSFDEAHGFLFVVDSSLAPGKGDQWLAEKLVKTNKPVLLVINKSDQIQSPEAKKARRTQYTSLFGPYEHLDVVSVSALTGKNMLEIPKRLVRLLPKGELMYPEDTLTDQRARDITQEMIREKAMALTQEELPHSIAVWIEKFDESNPACVRIEAVLYVDKPSQKGMVIGKEGQLIRKIGTAARKDIEALLDQAVFLDLKVKVKENWRKDSQFLKALGLI